MGSSARQNHPIYVFADGSEIMEVSSTTSLYAKSGIM